VNDLFQFAFSEEEGKRSALSLLFGGSLRDKKKTSFFLRAANASLFDDRQQGLSIVRAGKSVWASDE
jgi:hypothetical protein